MSNISASHGKKICDNHVEHDKDKDKDLVSLNWEAFLGKHLAKELDSNSDDDQAEEVDSNCNNDQAWSRVLANKLKFSNLDELKSKDIDFFWRYYIEYDGKETVVGFCYSKNKDRKK